MKRSKMKSTITSCGKALSERPRAAVAALLVLALALALATAALSIVAGTGVGPVYAAETEVRQEMSNPQAN